ncbi:hypothetical protein HAX54_033123, partial [Datura stramonium]|nr:hypothetical protein [Datura stramonium]
VLDLSRESMKSSKMHEVRDENLEVRNTGQMKNPMPQNCFPPALGSFPPVNRRSTAGQPPAWHRFCLLPPAKRKMPLANHQSNANKLLEPPLCGDSTIVANLVKQVDESMLWMLRKVIL